MYYKITFSKVLFALIDEDPDEYLGDFMQKQDEELNETLPENFTSKR